MAWTYDPELPTDKDRVRLLIGDTDSAASLFSDEELTALISLYGGVNSAAVAAARGLAAKYSRNADKWVGDLKILASQKARAYLDLATALEKSMSSRGVPSAGGIRISQKETMDADENRVRPSFRRNNFPYRGDD